MLRKHIFKDKARNESIRWRLHEPTRLEAFSDAVFAFALTLVVISLEVPQTFSELLHLMQGFFGFAICFLFLALIWHEQYIFFRRYGLQDGRTTFYNMALLFMVIYLVYPLKFLFYALSQGFRNDIEVHGKIVARFENGAQISQLMIIYGIGYFIIYILFALMHAHALKKRKDLHLSRLEVYNTRTFIMLHLGCLGIVVSSLLLAVYGLYHEGAYAFFSGIIYSAMGIVMRIIGARRSKKLKRQFSNAEIDEIKNEVILVEEADA